MPAASLGEDGWAKPWSDNGGSCLEAKKLPGGRVALRQSTDPASPALILEPHEIRAFVDGAKALSGPPTAHPRTGKPEQRYELHLKPD